MNNNLSQEEKEIYSDLFGDEYMQGNIDAEISKKSTKDCMDQASYKMRFYKNDLTLHAIIDFDMKNMSYVMKNNGEEIGIAQMFSSGKHYVKLNEKGEDFFKFIHEKFNLSPYKTIAQVFDKGMLNEIGELQKFDQDYKKASDIEQGRRR